VSLRWKKNIVDNKLMAKLSKTWAGGCVGKKEGGNQDADKNNKERFRVKKRDQ